MVIAVVGGMVFIMKVSAKENNSNDVLSDNDNGDDNNDSDTSQKR